MVATVLKLRYRILANSLLRRPSQLVGFIFGMLGALWLLGSVVAGFVAVAIFQGEGVAAIVAVIGGSALVLGWIVGPVLIAGTDTSVDAVKLAPFPFTSRQTMAALAGVGLTGIPGITTAIAALATVILWVRWPGAAVAAVPAALLGVLTCVLASRLMETLSRGLGGNRRGREIVGTVVLALLIMTGPIITGVLALLDSSGDIGGRLADAAGVLSWTPIGAAWAVPADLAAGGWATALAKLAIALATVVLLWVVWERALSASVSSAPRRATRSVRSGTLGLYGVMPSGGVGATWARALTGWLRDPRYVRQLIFVPLFPALFLFTSGVDGWPFGVSAVLVAFMLAVAGYADISYDGTAFASMLASGIRGRADRWGRVLGAACVGVPAVALVAVATCAVTGEWMRLPAVLGAAFGLLLVGYGVCAVSSALIVVPVAAPGDSPFKSVPGQTFVNGLLVFVVWGVCAVLAAPALVLAIVALTTSSQVLGAVALVVGVVVGAGVVVAGVLVGGRTLERTGPDLLQRIKAFPTT
ncbi:hypothetical protein [Microbacterium telephonicum]|uniref:ABC-2 type transport system permease protein n=1 Tax=Microbacterium telephonicum TaxID=1714841 RepID=A0A498CFM5_9MICO|nr:hypothetical protein [Microbacterium telephonicum]RLK53036.1 ABC-2 type transport system permease protein [Microbacterium telephonicum]